MQGNLHPLANPSPWTSSGAQERDRSNEEAGACLPQVQALGRKTETTTGRPTSFSPVEQKTSAPVKEGKFCGSPRHAWRPIVAVGMKEKTKQNKTSNLGEGQKNMLDSKLRESFPLWEGWNHWDSPTPRTRESMDGDRTRKTAFPYAFHTAIEILFVLQYLAQIAHVLLSYLLLSNSLNHLFNKYLRICCL